MRQALFVALCVVVSVGLEVAAMTWEFSDEEAATTSPWVAWQGWHYVDREIYESRIEGGRWIIHIPELRWSASSGTITPSLELLSPTIDHDSALFDRVRFRLRFETSTPFMAATALAWTNSSRKRPGRDGTVTSGSDVVVDGSWQEVVFDLRNIEEGAWEGKLQDFRLVVYLGSDDLPEGEGAVQSVEVDRITLTGVEEQLRGELPPTALEERTSSGRLLESAGFTPLGMRGVGSSGGGLIDGDDAVAMLCDLNGDGVLDLASVWRRRNSSEPDFVYEYGWMAVEGDGLGRFLLPRWFQVHGSAIRLLGGDTDGNGSAEILVTYSSNTQLLRNVPRSHLADWEIVEEFGSVVPRRVADGDGDGDVDLLVTEFDSERRVFTGLWTNDGTGRFAGREDLRPSQGTLIRGVPNACGDGRMGALWASGDNLLNPQHYLVTCLSPDGGLVVSVLDSRIPFTRLRFVGDSDGDDDIDLVASHTEVEEGLVGLSLLYNAGDGAMIESILDERVQVRSVQVADVDLDGRSDILVVDGDVRSPSLLVYVGRAGGEFALEGRYALGGLGGKVLIGDLNGDTWPDVVVLEPATVEGGGVYTFLNRGTDSRPSTVVSGDKDQDSRLFSTVSVNPNPFNSGVTIRLSVGREGDVVSMTVHNTAGQQVRSLGRGTFPGGIHEVRWDGSTDGGELVSSGVYFLRVVTGSGSIVEKMLVTR